MKRHFKLVVDPNPDYRYNDAPWVYIIDPRDENYTPLVTMLDRMEDAGVIYSYELDPIRAVDDCRNILLEAVQLFGERSPDPDEPDDHDYDTAGDGHDSDPGYRAAMNDAGRGAMLR